MVTSDPGLLEVDAPAKDCDAAAAAVCDKVADDALFVDADAAAGCPTASFKDVACKLTNAMDSGPNEVADVILFRIVGFGSTVTKIGSCPC